jgi:hypothetical protein
MQIKSRHTKAHTFASRSNQPHRPKLAKECAFHPPKKKFNFFSPSLRGFNFFANTQSTLDKQSDSLSKTLTGQRNLTRTTEARTANIKTDILRHLKTDQHN